MAPPTFNNITKDVNSLINADYYHGQPLALDISTTAKNGVKFDIKTKQQKAGSPLSTTIETKFNDKSTGLSLTQSVANSDNIATKIEVDDILTKGLKTELITSIVPDVSKDAKLNLSFTQDFLTARGNFTLINKPSFIGDFTIARDGVVGGAQLSYDITQGSLSSYLVALAYKQADYTVGVSYTDKHLSTISLFQNVSDVLQIGAKATTVCKYIPDHKNTSIEFATKYIPDESSQIKAKIQDTGILALAYKQQLRKGINVGIGASFNALNLNEPVHKIGGSLSFST
ncbi:hypothetical protein TPHA_0C03190 [Tetrapisispora phaffii CBS 4417]|uniref:Mitochondrial outer membrane protein porin n=1 Tax=Tetrapisispora phaffii (strain ATCC 24235 / CBS 4417 / NBRC 1672 / NRRL Y-8282 / UCD 70-5) TaxID=1071381 RepID=G8BRU6_TETPH|nr:hypothetical protein TPHA_0C03190 [Tetrapisispora phaffii CBS 4417]CCE62472.1 hypothetical protein TPHA_0C03190 [Tetrapisispora phaffii CBS 4417]